MKLKKKTYKKPNTMAREIQVKIEEFITASVSGGSRDCNDSDEEDQAELPTQQTSGYPKENSKNKRQRHGDPNSFSEVLRSNAVDQAM
ncbi:hypothetical protein QE152_g30429 [Popillia japonica]|uniref:Uncharacterized protein n=1 Tax=Popillia japonica TaxID=7064 RepID=A0AAW1JEP9_POPJA